MKPKSIVSLFGIAAFAAVVPTAASAQSSFSVTIGSGYGYPGYGYGYPAYGGYSRHDRQHEELDEEHDDIHDQLDEEHAQAHEEGLTPWEHAQLHRQLRHEHDDADYQLEREHQRQHWREAWRRRYWNYGYYGY